jgi:prolyl-tRNA synthetase
MPIDDIVEKAGTLLEDIQANLLARATAFRDEHMVKIDSEKEFRLFFTPRFPEKPEIHGGFALCHWAGTSEDENRLREELKVTIRCLPYGDEYAEEGTCFLTGQPSHRRVIFAKSY